ncbi:hypothetical protein [Veronia pacifica]|uniref:Uncharacterized protein n=1 Tax=Veronia pacifica TaxID=1080227 RepID=A0A1C3EJ84_9GAMM|nr:hypothetical protein [Veronia pacifica]ODA33279.1 hypothetical protein A8L45_10785 [Veronia pacifica]
MNISNGGYSPVYQQPVKHTCCEHNKAQQSEKPPLTPEQKVAGVEQGNGAKATADAKGKDKDAGSVESFAYGALGMDHPDEVKSNDDSAYSAGQALSALGTIGAVLSILI